MTFQNCPGIAQATLEYTDAEGDVAENVLHFTNGGSGSWSLADLTTLANTIDTWITTGDGSNNILGFVKNTASISAIATRDLTTQAGLVYIKTTAHTGGDTSAGLQAGLTKALTLRTGIAGRSYRGRIFVPCLTSGDVSSGDVNTMDATHLSHLVLAWGALIAAISGAHAGWKWVVLSRQLNKSVRVTGVGTEIASVGFSHPQFDYQRRRAPLHSRHH